MLKGKRLLEYKNLFIPNNNEKDEKILSRYLWYL